MLVYQLSLLCCLCLWRRTEAVSCYVGSKDRSELVSCLDLSGYQPFGNATVVRPNTPISCCLRRIRGSEVELRCADRKDKCSKNACYEFRLERQDAIGLVGYKRSQDCLCSSEGCNPAVTLSAPLSLLAAASAYLLA